MTSTNIIEISYDDVFNSFLGLIQDSEIASLNASDAYGEMAEYVKRCISDPYVSALFSDIECDDLTQMIKCEMDYAWKTAVDARFLVAVLAKGMVVEWLAPQVQSKVNIAQFFGGKEQNAYSQANHLNSISAVLENTKLELRRMILDRGFINNSYLEGWR